MDKLRRLIRYLFLRVVRLKDRPRSLALGLALGVFVGFTPTIPIQTYIAIGLALLFRASKIAAAAGVWISNPITLAGFYYADYVVGKWILGYRVAFRPMDYSLFTLAKEAERVMTVMMVGGIILGIPAGLLTYLIVYRIVIITKRRRDKRRLQRVISESYLRRNS